MCSYPSRVTEVFTWEGGVWNSRREVVGAWCPRSLFSRGASSRTLVSTLRRPLFRLCGDVSMSFPSLTARRLWTKFAFHVAQAIVLGRLIGYFDDDDSARWEGWTYACAVVLGGVMFR